MASIIADSFHLPKSVTKVIQRAKGLGRIILISDVAVMAGKEPGIYEWATLVFKYLLTVILALPELSIWPARLTCWTGISSTS